MNKRNPKISVVIPLYNVKKKLARSIESVISQTYSDWELLLVDDGSTDGSGAVCDAYAEQDDRIHVFHHQENKGFSGARNTGLRNASGEYLMFVDADDKIEPETFEICSDNMGAHGIDLVIGSFNWVIFDADDGKILTCETTTPGKDYFFRMKNMPEAGPYMWGLSTYAGCLHYCVWNRMFRKSIIDQYHIVFDETMGVFEDVQFTYTYLLYADKCMISKDVFYNYYRPSDKDDMIGKKPIELYQCAENVLMTVIKAGTIFQYPDDYQLKMYDRTHDLYLNATRRIFQEDWDLSEEEQYNHIVRMTNGFAFRFFCKVFAEGDSFWRNMTELMEAGNYRKIFEEWKKRAFSGLVYPGK